MECTDAKCPIHGSLKTHGYTIEGIVVSDKLKSTVIVGHDYTTFLRKYQRSLRKNSRMLVKSVTTLLLILSGTLAKKRSEIL